MTEQQRCQHPDCIYHVQTGKTHSETYNCNYMTITGHARTAGQNWAAAYPCNCDKYISSGQPASTGEPAKAKRPRRPKSWGTKPWHQEALKLYEQGLNCHQIAYKLDKAPATIRTALTGQGVKLMGKAPKFDWERALELYKQGATDPEIAKELGCQYLTVRSWRNRHDLAINYVVTRDNGDG